MWLATTSCAPGLNSPITLRLKPKIRQLTAAQKLTMMSLSGLPPMRIARPGAVWHNTVRGVSMTICQSSQGKRYKSRIYPNEIRHRGCRQEEGSPLLLTLTVSLAEQLSLFSWSRTSMRQKWRLRPIFSGRATAVTFPPSHGREVAATHLDSRHPGGFIIRDKQIGSPATKRFGKDDRSTPVQHSKRLVRALVHRHFAAHEIRSHGG